MTNTNLNIRDLINIGLFTALYIILFFAVGMTGYIPIMMLLLPGLIGLVGGIPILLLVSKVPKFGALTITGIIVSLFMFVTGHPWPILLIGIPVAIISDLIAKLGGYKKWPFVLCAYIVFSLWSFGAMYPLIFMKDTYLKTIEAGYGTDFMNKLSALMTIEALPIIIIVALLGSLIGGFIGRSVLKKHFKRAGIA